MCGSWPEAYLDATCDSCLVQVIKRTQTPLPMPVGWEVYKQGKNSTTKYRINRQRINKEDEAKDKKDDDDSEQAFAVFFR